MKVVLLDGASLGGHTFDREKKIFTENGIEFVEAACKTDADVIAACRDADGVMTIYCKLGETVIKELKKCKVFVRYGVGYDVIDIEAAARAGIAVCNLPDYCVQDVALHALALILNCLRKITIYDRSVRCGEWNSGKGYPVHRPERLTLGFLGFGNIARCTAAYAAPLGFTMLGYDPYLDKSRFETLGVRKVELGELFRASDILSVHAPLTAETTHIIDKKAIATMRDGVMIVNTSRGGLICFDDLTEAVKSGKVLAAGLDVVEREPMPEADRGILACDNVTVTPHASFNSIESAAEMHVKAAESACSVLRGERPPNTVNLRQLQQAGKK